MRTAGRWTRIIPGMKGVIGKGPVWVEGTGLMPVIEYVECDTAPLPLGPEMQALADSRNPASGIVPAGGRENLIQPAVSIVGRSVGLAAKDP